MDLDLCPRDDGMRVNDNCFFRILHCEANGLNVVRFFEVFGAAAGGGLNMGPSRLNRDWGAAELKL